MTIESGDSVEQSELVQIFVNRQRGDLFRALYQRRAKSELIHDWDSERLHHRTRVLSETLLAGNELVPMMRIFELPLLQIFRKSHIVMGAKQKTGSFSF